MKAIAVQFCVPGRTSEIRQLEVLDLVRTEVDLRFATLASNGLPERGVLNRVFMRGRGDDGFIPMTWEPFEIDDQDYRQLSGEFRLSGG